MIAISLEQPPASTPPELAEYLERIFIQLSGALAEAEFQIAALEKRIEHLEAKP